MPPEIIALIDKPLLLAAVLAVGGICGMMAERIGERMARKKKRAYWDRRRQAQGATNGKVQQLRATPSKTAGERSTPDAAEQLRTVMEATFKPRALLNQPERRLLAHLDKVLAEEAPGWRAMGQVSLGEILWSDDKEAFWAINAKRVDLLVVDADCKPRHAIEFQGDGHHQPGNGAAARDAVKKEALRRAGIGYVEIVSGDTPAELRATIRKLVARDGRPETPVRPTAGTGQRITVREETSPRLRPLRQ